MSRVTYMKWIQHDEIWNFAAHVGLQFRTLSMQVPGTCPVLANSVMYNKYPDEWSVVNVSCILRQPTHMSICNAPKQEYTCIVISKNS